MVHRVDDGFVWRHYWIPGDRFGRELPGDSELVAEEQLYRARLERALRRAQHRKRRRLDSTEHDTLRRQLTVTQRIDRKDAMLAIPSDDALAQDAEQLAEIAREVLAMALRWQLRFPNSNILKETVEAFLRDATTLSRAA
jgi:hypothetical protein